MIKKIKDKALHYWSNHKIESIVFVALIVALIVKQSIKWAAMNYMFTAVLIILFVLMAFFMEPGYIPIR